MLQKLIIFVKAPRAGFVKTRLAQTIGQSAAAQAYVTLVDQLLRNLASLTSVELRHAPDDAAQEISIWQQPGWSLHPQGDGDLGARLARAFAGSFAKGAERVVVIGSDCPSVQVDDIEHAWESLQSHDLVLGPAADGGYWLLGLRNHQPALFHEIHWSTDTVRAETMLRASTLGLRVHLMKERRDIDTEEDWRAYRASSSSDEAQYC